jgi:hypothetical protein
MTRDPVKITKLTIRDANVRGIYIPINLPGYPPMFYLFLPKGISDIHEFR